MSGKFTTNQRRLRWLILSALMLPLQYLSTPSHADMIDTSGMQPWETCALCHGLDGNSRMSKFPKLAGQDADYIEKQLRDFRSGNRSNDGGTMTAIASGELEEKNISIVANYFASQPAPEPSDGSVSGSLNEAVNLFANGSEDREIPACKSCHVEKNTIGAPHITSQHRDYLEKQLTDFKNAERSNDEKSVMRNIAMKLTDKEIANLSTYIATLPRRSANGEKK